MSERIVFKGSREGILIVIKDMELDFQEILNILSEKLRESKGFFNGSEVIVDVGQRNLSDGEIDDLRSVLEKKDLKLLRIVGSVPDSAENLPKISKRDAQDKGGDDIPAERTLLVKRTVRSGQCINYHGNVLILGDVNPGAEIIAGGDIIVMGSLRGVAHAGAAGNHDSIVVAFRLRPTQLRIGNYITRAPDGISVSPDAPEVARVDQGTIVIESYSASGDR